MLERINHLFRHADLAGLLHEVDKDLRRQDNHANLRVSLSILADLVEDQGLPLAAVTLRDIVESPGSRDFISLAQCPQFPAASVYGRHTFALVWSLFDLLSLAPLLSSRQDMQPDLILMDYSDLPNGRSWGLVAKQWDRWFNSVGWHLLGLVLADSYHNLYYREELDNLQPLWQAVDSIQTLVWQRERRLDVEVRFSSRDQYRTFLTLPQQQVCDLFLPLLPAVLELHGVEAVQLIHITTHSRHMREMGVLPSRYASSVDWTECIYDVRPRVEATLK